MILFIFFCFICSAQTAESFKYVPVDFRHSPRALKAYQNCIRILTPREDRPLNFPLDLGVPLRQPHRWESMGPKSVESWNLMLVHCNGEMNCEFDHGKWRIISDQYPGVLEQIPETDELNKFGEALGIRRSPLENRGLALFRNHTVDQHLSDSIDWLSYRIDLVYQIRVKIKNNMLRSTLGFEPMPLKEFSAQNVLDIIQALIDYEKVESSIDIDWIEVVSATNLFELDFPMRLGEEVVQKYTYFKINSLTLHLAARLSQFFEHVPVIARRVYSANYNTAQIFKDGQSLLDR